MTATAATVETVPDSPARRGLVVRIAVRVANLIGTLVLVLAGLALLSMTVGPRVFDYRTATMLTGSMVPTIRPGDVIVDVKERPQDIRVGQIITYKIPVDDHRVESHRVTWVGRDKDGGVLFRTKGDANNGEDPWTAKAQGTVWRVSTVVPVAGDVIRFLRQPRVQFGLTKVLPALLIASVLFSIWRRPQPDEDGGQ
jgi:signal peptidase I